MSKRALVRAKLEAGEFFAAPGLQDMVAAAIANEVGVEIAYGSGY